MWAGNVDLGTWVSLPQPDGSTANIPNAEIYATHIENKLRKEHGVPLRSHYSHDPKTLAPYEASRIIDKTNHNSLYYNTHNETDYKKIKKNQVKRGFVTPYNYNNPEY